MCYNIKPAPGITDTSWDRRPDIPKQPWWDNHPHPMDDWMLGYFPSRVELAASQPVTDVVAFGFYGVCEGIKTLIEELEPGVHQFVPFELVHLRDDSTRRYFTLIINRFFDAVDVDRSDVECGMTPLGYKWWTKKIGVPLVIRKSDVSGSHVWGLKSHPYKFVSDALYERLRAAGLGSGWRFEKQIEE